MAAPILQQCLVKMNCLHLKSFPKVPILHCVCRGYVKKLAVPLAVKKSKAAIEVETDAEKLTKYCCGLNFTKDGEDPELKADSDYPDWLWSLRTEREPVPLEELDKMTWAYWKRVKKMAILRDNKLASMRFKKP